MIRLLGIDPMRALYAGMAPGVWEHRPVLVLQAYIDDSGNHADSEVFVLAGFIAGAEDWIKFSERWHEALNRDPRIDYFKMSECWPCKGQFYGWSEESRDERLLELTKIIKETAPAQVFALVRRKDFDDLRAQGYFEKVPYSIVYYSVIAATIRSMREFGITEKVDFIFDEQMRLSDQVQSIYAEVLNKMEPSLAEFMGGRPIHGDDRNLLPLQAADLLAWHIRRWYQADQCGDRLETPALPILQSIRYWGMPRDRESLETLIEEAHFRTFIDSMTKTLRSDAFVSRVRDLISEKGEAKVEIIYNVPKIEKDVPHS